MARKSKVRIDASHIESISKNSKRVSCTAPKSRNMK